MLRVLRPEVCEGFQRLRADALVRHPHAFGASPGEDAAPDGIAARARLAQTQDPFIVAPSASAQRWACWDWFERAPISW